LSVGEVEAQFPDRLDQRRAVAGTAIDEEVRVLCGAVG
jgi:hypothetical protein